ncbi:hypothetical protein EJ03DRAFT_353621 [Teratosphaeria nubilosa]|uniref:SprT-like domain-containing protein n=1 Tax=Teratosphaeria nubilosa TaxID=161662 RepID=A0A6G1L1U5_9PEZI|nr:hypothetical protein EJ03DRAFT_353621 [Teratosphaeria nubilosa]
MTNSKKRNHAEVKSTRAGYTVTVGRHEPMTLVRTTITSIRAPTWSAMQMEGLQEWRDWIALWAGPEAGTAPLYELANKIFSKIFFLGRLRVAKIIFEKHISERGYYGVTESKDGTHGRVTITLDPDDVRRPAGHRAGLLGTFLHECVHAFFHLYACGCDNCRPVLGPSGHGQSWFYLASHVEAVARRHLAEVGRVSVWWPMLANARPEYIPTASDWQELLEKFTLKDLSDLVSARLRVRETYFMNLLTLSRAQDGLEVEGVVGSTVTRWMDGMMDLRSKRRDGLLTAKECDDLEFMEVQLTVFTQALIPI